MVCHAPTKLHNRAPLVWHEKHPVAWHNTPFQGHNTFLLTLDSHYNADWCTYCEELRASRTDGQHGDDAREDALREGFRRSRYPWRKALIHAGRIVRACAQEWRMRARRGRFGLPPRRSAYGAG